MKPWVIKLGGAALSYPDAVKQLAQSIMTLKSEGHQVVIVHGGGPTINQRLTEQKIAWTFHEGQRVTTSEMMKVIASALGEVNKTICNVFNNYGLQASGIQGHEKSIFLCQQMNADLGLVGEVIKVQTSSIEEALNLGLIPVIAPVGVDADGLVYNINADWGASSLATELGAEILIFATDQRGILDIIGLPYDSLTKSQLKVLMEKGGVTGGMLAKCRSIESALSKGVNKVCVAHALEMNELIQTKVGGTLCVAKSRLEHMKENHYAVS